MGPTDATDLLDQCQWVGLQQQKLISKASEAKLTDAVEKTELTTMAEGIRSDIEDGDFEDLMLESDVRGP